MSTTAIFFELLIIGLQAGGWICLVGLSFGIPEISDAQREMLGDYSELASLAVVACSYSLGLVIDRGADTVLHFLTPLKALLRIPFVAKARERILSERTPDCRLRIAFREGKATEFLLYFRSRLRVLRGTTVNAAIYTIAIPVFLVSRGVGVTLVVGGALFGVIVTLGIFAATGILEAAYDFRQFELSVLLKADSDSGADSK